MVILPVSVSHSLVDPGDFADLLGDAEVADLPLVLLPNLENRLSLFIVLFVI